MTAPVPRFASREVRDAVRDLLAEAGYREERLCALLRTASLAEAFAAGRLSMRRKLSGGAPPAVLARLFLLGDPVPPGELAEAAGERGARSLRDAGLVDAEGRATAQLAPTGHLLVASDRRDRHREKPADFVLGPSPVARALAEVTIRRPVERTLDLCCGCGLLGLLAAPHSRRVVGADLNPRAVAFARFNAELNGAESFEAVEGDLFAPAGGERFDLVLCNPPFVLSPDTTFLYRDGGGAFCERVVREAPAHLAEGGCLEMLCNWPEPKGRDWREGVARWFEGTPCDAWVLRQSSLDAATYATVWLAQECEGEVPAERFDAWMRHLEEQGIDSVGGGLVVMRPARGRAPWLELRDAPAVAGEAGESIARALDARDLAARAGGAALLDARLVPSPDLEQVARRVPSGDGWNEGAAELRLARGLRFAARVDPVAAEIVGLLDGKRTLGEALALLAAQNGVSPDPFREDLPRAVARLLELGLVLPAS